MWDVDKNGKEVAPYRISSIIDLDSPEIYYFHNYEQAKTLILSKKKTILKLSIAAGLLSCLSILRSKRANTFQLLCLIRKLIFLIILMSQLLKNYPHLKTKLLMSDFMDIPKRDAF